MRIVSTILFVLATVVASIVSVPAALLDRSGRSYMWVARMWAKSFVWLYGLKLDIQGLGNIDRAEHYVVIANHASYTDVPIAIAALPLQIRMILRHTLTRIPVFGWALLASPFLIIDRTNAQKAQQTLAKAVQTIRGGASVLLFPEGTRSATGQLQPFKRGAFKLAFDSETTLLPVAMIGTFDVLPRTSTLPETGRVVKVRVGEPIKFVQDPHRGTREQEMALMKLAEERIRDLIANG